MIRRGFWLVVGAALGVTGYRRAGKLARALQPGRRPLRRGRPAGTAAFLRDVRDGMDEYLERHPGRRGPSLDGQQVRGRLRADPGRSQEYPDTDYAKDGR